MPLQSRGAVQWHGREPILTGEPSAHASVRHLEKEWRSCATYGESSAVLPATMSARAWAVLGLACSQSLFAHRLAFGAMCRYLFSVSHTLTLVVPLW